MKQEIRIVLDDGIMLVYGGVPASLFLTLVKWADAEKGLDCVSATEAIKHGATFAFIKDPETQEEAGP